MLSSLEISKQEKYWVLRMLGRFHYFRLGIILTNLVKFTAPAKLFESRDRGQSTISEIFELVK